MNCEQIAPGFLIAPPALIDPQFSTAVVALATHEKEGSMGFILTRATDLTLYDLLQDLNIKPEVPDRPVLLGGPLSTQSGFVLYEHAPGEPMSPGLVLTETISISPSRSLLEDAAAGKLPGRFDLVLGYAGWGPGQLESEIDVGGWLHSNLDPDLVFNVPLAERWQQAFERLGVSPLSFMHVPGGAQA